MRSGRFAVACLIGLAAYVLLALGGCMVATSSEYTESYTSPGSSGSTSGGGNEIVVRDLRDTDSPNKLAGKWEAKVKDRRQDFIQLSIVEGSNDNRRQSVSGLSRENLKDLASGNGPVHVVWRRDAGTLTFDGSADGKGRGSGDVVWEVDANYVAEMSKLTGETITARRALDLAIANLELSYARGMADAGYKFSTSDLLSLRFGGISPEYAKGFKNAGYNFTADDLRSLRFGGIDPDWAKKFHDAGYEFSVDQLRSLRFGGVDPDDAATFRRAGYRFGPDELRSLRFGGVSAQYAAALADAGYKFTPDELRRLRFTGVGDDFAVALRKAGYNFSAEDLARLRSSGVSADYACDLAVPGKKNLSADEIIDLRRRGIDSNTIKKLRQ